MCRKSPGRLAPENSGVVYVGSVENFYGRMLCSLDQKDRSDERFGNHRGRAKRRLANSNSLSARKAKRNLSWLQATRRSGGGAGECGRVAGSDELREGT